MIDKIYCRLCKKQKLSQQMADDDLCIQCIDESNGAEITPERDLQDEIDVDLYFAENRES